MLSETGYWILFGSIFLGLAIMIAAWLIMRHKIKKIKNKYETDESKFNDVSKIKHIEDRGEEHGVLLWTEKKKEKNPLDDYQMEFLINTVIRNRYKKFSVSDSNTYISKSLVKLAKATSEKKNPDIIIQHNWVNLNDEFDVLFKTLKVGGLVVVTNAYGREAKKLMSYARMTGIRREQHKKIGKGIILLAK